MMSFTRERFQAKYWDLDASHVAYVRYQLRVYFTTLRFYRMFEATWYEQREQAKKGEGTD
jgi:hypothetical protein